MKQLIVFVFSLLTLSTFGQTNNKSENIQENDWYKLESKELGFKIEFPKKPKSKVLKANPKHGYLHNEYNQFIYAPSSKKDDNFAYLIYYSEYPDSLYNSENINTDTLQRLYKSEINIDLDYFKGTLMSEKTIILKGHSGVEAIINSKTWGIIISRYFLVKNKFYVIEVETDPSKVSNPSISHFMSSFDLL